MTQPPPEQPPGEQPPYGPPPYVRPPQYGPPPYGSPPYAPPQPPPYGQAPYGQVPYGQAPYGPPQYAPPPYGPASPYFGPPPEANDPLVGSDYAGWWRRSWTIVKFLWPKLAQLQATTLVAAIGLFGLGAVAAIPAIKELIRSSDAGDSRPPLGPIFTIGAIWMVVGILVALVDAIVRLATVQAVVRAVTGSPPRIGECLSAALPRLLPLIGWSLLSQLIVMGGYLACFFPAYYFFAVFTFLTPAVAFERGSIIRRCFKLFHGDIGAALGRILTILAVSAAAPMAGYALMLVAMVGGGFMWSDSPVRMVTTMAVTVALIFVLSFAARILTETLMLTGYADIRARIEPVSTTVLASELGMTMNYSPA